MPRTYPARVQCICEICGQPFETFPCRIKIGRGRFCGQQCEYKSRSIIPSLEDRFAAFLARCTTNDRGCLVWNGQTNSAGYGVILTGGGGTKPLRAHRVAWEMSKGPIPDGLDVLHRCDNPACVNVDHLFVGTHLENMEDMSRKGRTGGRKLTEDDVRKIRLLSSQGIPSRQVAAQFGVTKNVVRQILTGKTWRHVV